MQERAGILINLGQYTAAEHLVDQLIDRYKKEGNELSANYYKGWRAMIYYYTAQYEQALELINETMETGKDNLWDRNLRAAIFSHMHDLERANQDYAWILEKRDDPNYRDDPLYYAWATLNLGLLDFNLLDESIQYSNQALKEPDGAYEGYMNLCKIYLVRGDFNYAQEYLNQALQLAKDPRMLANARLDFELLAWVSEAKNWSNGEDARNTIRGFLDQVEQRNGELQTYDEQRSLVEAAIQELHKIRETEDPQEDVVLVSLQAGLARLYLENRQWSQALEAYRSLAESSMNFPEASLGIENVATAMIAAAKEFYKTGQDEDSEQLLARAEVLMLEMLNAHPQRDASIHQLADDYYRTFGKTEKAVELFTKIREVKGEENEASYQNRVGNVRYYEGNYQSAEDHYRKAVDADQTQAVYFSNLAGALKYQKRWEESRAYYKKAFEISARQADFNREMALTYNSEGIDHFDHKRQESINYYHIALEKSEGDPEYQRRLALAYNDLGNHFVSQNDYQNAVEQYRHAIDLYKDDPVIYTNLGVAYRKLKNWESASESFQKAYAINADEKSYNRQVALNYNDQGVDHFSQERHLEAIQAYSQAVELDPEDPVFYSNIALAHTALENWQEAVNYYQIALEKSEGGPEYERRLALAYNDLGNHFYAQGDFQNAVEQYHHAVDLHQDDPVMYLNLGGAYRELKKWKSAFESFKKAYDINSDQEMYDRKVAEVHYAIGSDHFDDQEYEKAHQSFQQAVEHDPTNSLYDYYLKIAEIWLTPSDLDSRGDGETPKRSI